MAERSSTDRGKRSRNNDDNDRLLSTLRINRALHWIDWTIYVARFDRGRSGVVLDGESPMTTAVAVRPVQSNPMPVFDTGLPIIGKIDFNNPVEWLWWGALGADLLWVSGMSKWIIAAGIVAARYEIGRACQ